jgi:hypothetical protein
MGGFSNPTYKIVFEEADKMVRSILSSLLFMEIHMVKVGQLHLRPVLSQDYFGNISGTISSTTIVPQVSWLALLGLHQGHWLALHACGQR